MQKIDVNGLPIAVRSAGESGPAVVFVHGNSASSAAFEKQFESDLAQEMRLIGLDLPGHGESNDSDDLAHYSLPGYAQVVAAVADAMNATDAVFVGWSLGGHILLEGVETLPQAKGFAIFGTPPLGKPPVMEDAFLPTPTNAVLFNEQLSDEEATAFATAFFKPGVTPPPAFISGVQRAYGKARLGLGASVAEGRFKNEIEVVRTMKRPLMVLHGEEEQLVSGTYLETLEMPTLWRGKVQTIADAGHAPQWEQPERFNTLLREFVHEVNA
jgi:pimeloyl-ACP methyl ester carboxylesterase